MKTTAEEQLTFASFYDFYDGPEHRQAQLAMYRNLAGEAGFTIRDLWGGHDGEPLGPRSYNMIFVAVKR